MKQKFDIRTLEKSKLEASFNPPDNYVDNFTTRLMQQIPAEAVQPGASSPGPFDGSGPACSGSRDMSSGSAMVSPSIAGTKCRIPDGRGMITGLT